MKTTSIVKVLVLSLIITLSLPLVGFAALTITSVNNGNTTISNGQSIPILGNGFGTKSSAGPKLWDTVDNQPAYSKLASGATIPTGSGYPWQNNSSGDNNIKLNTTECRNGGKCYKATSSVHETLDDLNIGPGTGQIYVSWWWKTANDVSGTTHSSKFLRLSNSSDITNKTFSWTQREDYNYETGLGGYCPEHYGGDWPGVLNQWNFMEVWIDSSTMKYSVRVNGAPYADNVTWTCTPFIYDYLWKIGFDGGGTSPPAITSWMDDIYVDTSFARVMIGNASTYAASTHFEMQPPVSWSASQVQITVNQGSFAANSTAYLYVVDSTGAVSSGQKITFGNSGGASVPAPTVTATYSP
jgi:hypothetical protein